MWEEVTRKAKLARPPRATQSVVRWLGTTSWVVVRNQSMLVVGRATCFPDELSKVDSHDGGL